jgi:hypothetical protein
MGRLDTRIQNRVSSIVQGLRTTKATITRTVSIFNPLTGEEQAKQVHKYKTFVSPPANYRDTEIDGSAIKRGDQRVIIPAIDLAIEPDSETDVLAMGAIPNEITYQIVTVQPISPGDEIAAWKVQLRR